MSKRARPEPPETEVPTSKLETILNALVVAVAPGLTTGYLNELAESLCRLHGVEPAFKGYKPPNFGGKDGFPAAICVSIDNEVIHGIPGDRKIEDGQVVKIDIGLVENGQYDDGATTVLVGKCSATARRLVQATREALEAGVAQAKMGKTTQDIAAAVEAVAKKYEFHVVHGYGGHGIGEELHMPPHIPNEVDGSAPVPLEAGKRIAIEPMLGSNHGHTFVDKDGWTVKLRNGGLAAHFERTVTIS